MNQCVCVVVRERAWRTKGLGTNSCSRISFLLTETHGKEKIGPTTGVCFKLIRVIRFCNNDWVLVFSKTLNSKPLYVQFD